MQTSFKCLPFFFFILLIHAVVSLHIKFDMIYCKLTRFDFCVLWDFLFGLWFFMCFFFVLWLRMVFIEVKGLLV